MGVETAAGGGAAAAAAGATASADAADGLAGLGGHTLSQLGPLALLALGALMLQLGVAVLVDALADQRSRALVAREYASEHCLVCGASRSSLDKLGVRGFEMHVRKTHNPEAYARLLADASRRTPSQRTDDDRWLVDCAERSDPSFLPSASREYWDASAAAGRGVGGGAGGFLASGGMGAGSMVGWRPGGWDPGGEAALGWQLSPEPTSAQLRAGIEQLAAEGARCAAEVRRLARQGSAASAVAPTTLTSDALAALQPAAAFHATSPPAGGGADWDALAERLAALERASTLQAEQTGHATREASRVASELHHRFATAHDTATAVMDLTRLVTTSSATVERVMDEVDALRTAMGLTAAAAPAAGRRGGDGNASRREIHA